MNILIILLFFCLALCLYRISRLARENRRNYKFYQLVENSPDGFRIVENGLMTYANKKFCEMTGYSKEELYEKPFELIFTVNSLDIVKDNIKLRRKLQSSSYEAELLRKDQSTLPVIVSGQPIVDKNGKWIGNCGVFTDISKLKKIESELRQAEQKLFHSQKLEALGQLSGGIAHDFNNLLAVILGNLEILNNKVNFVEGASKYITRAMNGAKRASSLTRRLLAFSRKQGLLSESTDIRALLLGMMDLLTSSVGESIIINLDIEKDLWFALVDSNQLEAVLINLVVNSRDAMPEGGKITIECKNISLNETSDLVRLKNLAVGDYVKISVKDQGQGISPDLLPKIFEPFFTTKSVGKGSGLGMSIAYGFAKESNGFLDVESIVGQGTEVSLFIPKTTEKPKLTSGENELLSSFSGNNQKILVIEDDEEVRKLIENMLDYLGYFVICAVDLNSAKNIIDKEKFDLVLADVVLPDGSGSEISTIYEGKVLFMSGYTDLGGISRLSEADRGDLLNKPFKMIELAQRIKSKLS